MTAVIDGKLYDTAKATILLRNEVPQSALYMTQKGAFFIAHQGSDEYSGTIEVVTEDAAKAMLGKYRPEKYLELFGEVEEA